MKYQCSDCNWSIDERVSTESMKMIFEHEKEHRLREEQVNN